MAKVKINSLPEGFEIRNGKVVQTMSKGGYITGDQMTNGSYGLVTIPTSADGSELGGLPSMPSIRYSLAPVPRDEANIEAEKGETVLTDLDEDGNFELYDIGGKRHTGGGTPLNLPPQSFIFSDTAKARFNKGQLADLGITSKKKITPAKASKHFELNPYIGALADPHSDKITDSSAELMLEKNKQSLSHIAFMQEERKKFKEGVPLAAHPYLTAQGVDPIEFSMQVEEINRKEAEDAAIAQLPPEQQQKMLMLRQFMEQAEAQQAQQDQEMGMEPPPPQQQQMQPPPGMAQGMPPQGMGQPGMQQPQMPPPQMMGRYGGQPCYDCGGEHNPPLRRAQAGTEIPEFSAWAQQYAQTPEFQALLESGEVTMENANDYLTQMWTQMYDAEFNQVDDALNNYMMEYLTTPEGQALVDEAVASGTEDIQGYIEEKIKPFYDQYVADNSIQPMEPLPANIIDTNTLNQNVQGVDIPIQDESFAYETIPFADSDPLQEMDVVDDAELVLPDETITSETTMIEDPDNPGQMIEGTKQEGADYFNYQTNTSNPSSFAEWRIENQTGDGENIPLSDANQSDIDIEDYSTVQDDIDIKGKVSEKERIEALTVGKGGDYIDKIIDYELNHGAGDGTGLSINAAFFDGNKTGATREDARKLIEQKYDVLYKDVPDGLKGRIVDFHINSEDPRASLLVAAGLITPQEKIALYDGVFKSKTGKSMPNTDKVDELWKKHQAKVEKLYNTPSFVQRFDAEKHRSYKGIGNDSAYDKSWGPRVDMWNDDFKYDNWTVGQYYSIQDNGTFKPTTIITEKEKTTVIPPAGQDKDGKPVVTIEPEKEKVVPEWEKGYNNYKEYWESDDRKSLREATYKAYKLRAEANGVTPLSEDKFHDLWLREQRQKRYLTSLKDEDLSGEEWDSHYAYKNGKKDYSDERGKNWKYKETIGAADDELGFTTFTDDEVGHTELAFHGMSDVHELAKGDPLLEKMFEGSYVYHGGNPDEGYAGKYDISAYDEGYAGNTWNRQFHDVKPKVEEPEEEIIEKEEMTWDITTPEVGVEAELPRKDFWLQDILGTANAVSNKYRVNKYYPWAPMIEKPRLQPVFDDPTRRIAAINEQKTISDQARAMYSGPQSLAAFTGKSSGQALKGVADLVDRVNRYNVDTANKFEGLNANMDFMTQRLNNATRTKLYNDTMLTEQNYDNAMAQADMAITRQLQNAFTNRANTYNMNTLYDQYNVDPMSGGMINFTNPRSPYPTDNRGQADREKQYFDFMQRHSKLYPDQTTSPFPAFKWIQGQNQPFQGYNPQQQQMMSMMRGSPYGVPNIYNQGQQNWNNQYVQPYGY